MSKHTNIQYADGTCNPFMGCEQGCELWATPPQIITAIEAALGSDDLPGTLPPRLLLRGMTTTVIYRDRKRLARMMAPPGEDALIAKIEETIAGRLRCYAGQLHLRYGAGPTQPSQSRNPGYARQFEVPELFPGRVAQAAAWSDLCGTARADKPWANGLPRIVFVSDMGDSLSRSISFEDLHTEIITPVASPLGRRHIWLWFSKQPARMAEFGRWLNAQGITWPDHLVAVTSVTSQATAARIPQIRRVPCRFRGLSVEPLLSPVTLPLEGIDWCAIGGESGSNARPFDLAWARDLITQCRANGTAVFMKQLGRHPVVGGAPLILEDSHGGDWDEWPEDLRIRQYPAAFASDQENPGAPGRKI